MSKRIDEQYPIHRTHEMQGELLEWAGRQTDDPLVVAAALRIAAETLSNVVTTRAAQAAIYKVLGGGK